MILDTSFLIDIQNGDDGAIDTAVTLEQSAQPRRVPHVVIYELFIGVGKGVQSQKNRDRIDQVLDAMTLEPTTVSIARRAGKLEGQLQQTETGLGAVDALIGATALSYDEPVLTADTEHFDRLPAVSVRTYNN